MCPPLLQSLLKTFGEYPDRYRLLIWRFLMRLPENRESFRNLVAKGVHPAFADLHERYPIQNMRLFQRLRRVLSALAHWSPVFGELPYLPALAFPFVKLFERDDLSAMEAIMTVFLNWGAGWVDTYPHAPMQVLGAVDGLLAYHDPALAKHLRDCGTTAQDYAWTLMRSLFTEVLTTDEVRVNQKSERGHALHLADYVCVCVCTRYVWCASGSACGITW